MNELFALEMGRNALLMTVMLAAPMMGAALLVGLLDQRLPGADPDQRADPDVRPQDPGRLRGAAAGRPVADAQPGRLHRRTCSRCCRRWSAEARCRRCRPPRQPVQPDHSQPRSSPPLTAAYVTFYVLAAVRVLGAIAFNPLLGSARVPMPGRIGIGLFATLVLFPVGGPFEAPANGRAARSRRRAAGRPDGRLRRSRWSSARSSSRPA